MARSTFSSQVPFLGFYYSPHSNILDTEESRIFQDHNEEEHYEQLQEVFDRHVDWSAVYKEYAKLYVDYLKSETSLSLKFEEMTSPREYNFETDRVFVSISRSDLCMMLKKVRGECLDKVIRERFTSRSGFISFYPNRISRWPRIEDWDHNHVGTVLLAYLEKEFPRVEESILEEMYGSCEVSEILYNCSDYTGKSAIDLAYLKSRLKDEGVIK